MLAVCGLSLSAQAGTIYLCKAYSGGLFWSNIHCNQRSALIERITSVPDGMPFDQQVAIATQARNAAAQANAANTTDNRVRHKQTGTDRKSKCAALDAQIQRYDSMARQPQSGQKQDAISAKRKTARDRQFQLRC